MNRIGPSLENNSNFSKVEQTPSKMGLHQKIPEGKKSEESRPISEHTLKQCQDRLKISFDQFLKNIQSGENAD